jgi:hypothetical protein
MTVLFEPGASARKLVLLPENRFSRLVRIELEVFAGDGAAAHEGGGAHAIGIETDGAHQVGSADEGGGGVGGEVGRCSNEVGGVALDVPEHLADANDHGRVFHAETSNLRATSSSAMPLVSLTMKRTHSSCRNIMNPKNRNT